MVLQEGVKMKYSENIIPISEVKAHTAQMVDHVVR